jgi:hypothetical protein
MSVDLDAPVQLAARILADHPDWDDQEISQELKNKGISPLHAEQLIAFVPLAFGRVFFAENGPRFSPYYELHDLKYSRKIRLPLLDEPVFMQATELAQKWWATNTLCDQAHTIACRSAEASVIVELTQNGTSLSDIGFTDPLMLRLPFPDAKSRKKLWWKFWQRQNCDEAVEALHKDGNPDNARKSKQVLLMPESLFQVKYNDEKIWCIDPSGQKSDINWDDIMILKIRTTDEGPMLPDVFWEFYNDTKKLQLVFPGGATGENEILKAVQSKLSGFDNRALINAMKSTTNNEFIVWQKGA